MSVFVHVFNSYTAPTATFEALNERKRWTDAIPPLVILAFLGIVSMWFLRDLLVEIQLDQAVKRIEQETRLDDDQKEEMILNMEERVENPSAAMRIVSWVSSGLSTPIRVFMMTLIAMVIGNVLSGNSVAYSRFLPLISYAYMITILEQVIKIPLMLNAWSVKVYTGLGLLGIGAEGTFIQRFFAGLDFFGLWRLILIALAMGILYKKDSRSFLIAMGLFWIFQSAFIAVLGSIL